MGKNQQRTETTDVTIGSFLFSRIMHFLQLRQSASFYLFFHVPCAVLQVVLKKNILVFNHDVRQDLDFSFVFFWKDFGQRTGATFCPGVPLAKVVGHTCSFSYCAHQFQHAVRFASEVALRSHSHSLVCVKCELWVHQIVRETVPAKLDVPGVCQPSSWRSMMDPLKLGYQDWDEDTPEDDSKIILVLCISRKSIASPLAKAHFRRLTKIVKLTVLDLLKVKQVVHCTCTGGQSQRLLVVSEKCSQPGQLGRKFYCRFLSFVFCSLSLWCAGASTFTGRGRIREISRDGRWTLEKVRWLQALLHTPGLTYGTSRHKFPPKVWQRIDRRSSRAMGSKRATGPASPSCNCYFRKALLPMFHLCGSQGGTIICWTRS